MGDVRAHHAREANQWATCTFDFSIERHDYLVQFSPQRHAVDFGREAITLRYFFLGSILKVAEAFLHDGSWVR